VRASLHSRPLPGVDIDAMIEQLGGGVDGGGGGVDGAEAEDCVLLCQEDLGSVLAGTTFIGWEPPSSHALVEGLQQQVPPEEAARKLGLMTGPAAAAAGGSVFHEAGEDGSADPASSQPAAYEVPVLVMMMAPADAVGEPCDGLTRWTSQVSGLGWYDEATALDTGR
jgi:hypothetical protein